MGIFFLGGLGFSLQSWKSPTETTKAQGQFPQDDGTIPLLSFAEGRPGRRIVFGDGDDLRGEKIRSRVETLKKFRKLLVNSENSNH